MKIRICMKQLILVLLAVLLFVLSGIMPGSFSVYAAEKEEKRPTVLLILDGFGLNEQSEHNAIALADTPVLDRLMKECPFVKGNASGLAVGLPDGQMGSSEVGHLNIGAGRIVYQDLSRITKEIEDGDFFENEALLKAVNNAKEKGTSLHIYGLVSDGGVHSHNSHLYALLKLAKQQGLEKVYVHCFTDGRDTPPESGKDYIQALQDEMDRIGCGSIATVAGRYYAMDRDNNWDRVEKAYRALTRGEGVTASSAMEALSQSYEKGETDEFIQPTVVVQDGAPVATIDDGDSIIFFNFRPDRAREITRAFCCDEFDSFDRGPRKQVTYVCFTDYDVTIPNKEVAFEKETLTNTFGEWLAENGMKQARIAETEKYAHVTFFFNGGVEAPNEGEDRFMIPSPKVATYDLQPEMSVPAVCDTVVEKIHSGEYDVIIANFANSDMVGHTGVEKAAIEAVTCIDECIGRVVEAVEETNGQLFICADHGNAEMMVDYETGEPWTAHTTNPVPFILVNYDPDYTLREGGCLADIAPTLIEMMGMVKPVEMTGESLLIKKEETDPKVWRFTDVKEQPGNWVYDSAKYVYNRDIMTGMGPDYFGAAETLSRGQFATILYRMSGAEAAYKQIFPDVKESDWFGIPVTWCNKTGVVTGYKNGLFGPGDDITREQLATMLYRYAEYFKYDISETADLSKYPDAGSVSDWAKEALEWAVGAGIVKGQDGGKYLDPQGQASRAECATMVMRFMEKYVEK